MNTVPASPYPYPLPPRDSGERVALVIIDMQRDFVEPGGFGAALGNKVEHLQKIVPTVAKLLRTFRELRLPVIHTREGHRPDLSDCPPRQETARRFHTPHRRPRPHGTHSGLGRAGKRYCPRIAS